MLDSESSTQAVDESRRDKDVKLDVLYKKGLDKKENIRESLVAPIEEKLWEMCIRWYWYVYKRLINVLVRRCKTVTNMYFNRGRQTKEDLVNNVKTR